MKYSSILHSIEKCEKYRDYLDLLNKHSNFRDCNALIECAVKMCFSVNESSKYLGNGASRTAIKFDDVVIKIITSKYGACDNSDELRLIRFLRNHHYKHLLEYLCPIFKHNKYINIVPLCTEVPKEMTMEYASKDGTRIKLHPNKLFDIVDEFNKVGIEFSDIEDAHQWGMLDGRLVLLDYSCWFYTGS